MYRINLAFVFMILLAAGLGACSNEEKKPNIILVMADDQGWGDMAYNNHPVIKTPNFDAMAREGILFDRFYASAPVCSPTRGSVMTGRHPNRFGCFSWGHTLRPQEVTIAETLKEAGYVTGHFGKWHLGSVYRESPVSPGMSGFDEWLSAPNFFDNDPILSRNGKAVQCTGESSMVTVDAALEFIGKQKASKQPFFAVVWFGSPHQPHRAIERDQELYPDQEEDFRHFYGEITGMDRAFGKLRDRLREWKISDNTILWYCSDNGGLRKYGTTGGRGIKGQIYEGGLRVPAIIEWPDQFDSPKVIQTPGNTYDIYPTLLDLIGEEMPADQPMLDGISLVDIINGESTSRSTPMGFWDFKARGISTPSAKWMQEMLEAQQQGKAYSDEFHLRMDAGEITKHYSGEEIPGHAAWLDWPWKLHRISENGEARFELYNLVSDPMEEKDLSDEKSELVELMKAKLNTWQVSVIGSLNGEDY